MVLSLCLFYLRLELPSCTAQALLPRPTDGTSRGRLDRQAQEAWDPAWAPPDWDATWDAAWNFWEQWDSGWDNGMQAGRWGWSSSLFGRPVLEFRNGLVAYQGTANVEPSVEVPASCHSTC